MTDVTIYLCDADDGFGVTVDPRDGGRVCVKVEVGMNDLNINGTPAQIRRILDMAAAGLDDLHDPFRDGVIVE
jgi:hypothetical protein